MKGVVFLFSGAILWLAAAGVSPCQEPAKPGPDYLTLSVKSQLVELYFTVTEDKRRVSELNGSDLSLYEDGARREIHRLDAGETPLQIALLLDISQSMREALYTTQEAAVSFLDSLRPNDRVALIAFSADVRIAPQLTEDRSPIIAAIRSTQARGITRLYDALLLSMRYLSGKEGRKAIVVFSDGEDTARRSSLEMVINGATRYGFPIYSIYAQTGSTSGDFRKVLRQLTEINSGRMFMVEHERDLRAAFAETAAELRAAFVAGYYTQAAPDGRWHEVKLTHTNPGFKIHTRAGFFADRKSTADPEVARAESPALADPSAAAPRVRMTPPSAAEAKSALSEILATPAPTLEIPEPPPMPQPAQAVQKAPRPVFKVESRFVEVPVLVEATGDKEPAPLSERDFRLYEDDALREVVFFRRDFQAQDLPRLRDLAVQQTRPDSREAVASDVDELVLGRYYLVVDNMLTDAAGFQASRQAAEKIIHAYHSGLRRFSVHFASDSRATILSQEDTETILEQLRKAPFHSNRELTSNDNIMSIHEAYLIERGDLQATLLAELRYAASLAMTYHNELGTVEGEEVASPEMIRSGVQSAVRTMITENYSQVSRTIDGLRAVVSAASIEPCLGPKVVIFLSSGFVLGRTSGRGDMSTYMDNLLALAKRHGIRLFTIDASGLTVDDPIGIGTNPSFLVRNPHLQSILFEHMRGWRSERESTLNQMASETGGRLTLNTNDLAGAAGTTLNTTGALYYLGYLSNQPPDGRFHRIRVTASDTAVRLRFRSGYVAGGKSRPQTTAEVVDNGEDWHAVFARAEEARKSGDLRSFISSLELLVRRFPDQPNLWYNLGAARLNSGDPARAVEALQRAFALAPDDRVVGMSLARALAADGHGEAGADVLSALIRRSPRDSGLFMELGRVYESDGLPEQAHQAYRSVLDLSSSPPLDLYLLLVRTSMNLGRRIEAELFIEDYLKRGGETGKIDVWRRQLAVASSDPEKRQRK